MSQVLIAELKRRRVFRALVGYGVAAFAVLQIIEPIMHGLHWPDAVLSYVVVALAIGFPIVVTLAWIFDVNAGVIERTQPSPSPGLRGPRLLFLLVGLGVLAAVPGLAWYFLRVEPRAKAAIVEPPPEPGSERWQVPLGSSPVRGPADAPVTIVEFADYQCPYSKIGESRLQKLLARYPGKLRVAWKDYPMGAHIYADAAALLARETLRQKGPGAFWEVHDKLFALSPAVGPAVLDTLAAAQALDAAETRKAIEAERYRREIDADVDQLVQLGEHGIPTFFVNGRKVVGVGPELEQVVADELAEARRRMGESIPPGRLYEVIQRGARVAAVSEARVTMPDAKDRPARGGPADRALLVHEFCELSDLACAWIEPALRKTLDSYGDEVRLVWWDITDPRQPAAVQVRRAAYAMAGVPDGFWKMHDFILAAQRRDDFAAPPPETLSLPALRRQAQRLGADLALFDYNLATGVRDDERQLEEARALDRHVTHLVIDGQVLGGFDPPRVWRKVIDAALARRR